MGLPWGITKIVSFSHGTIAILIKNGLKTRQNQRTSVLSSIIMWEYVELAKNECARLSYNYTMRFIGCDSIQTC